MSAMRRLSQAVQFSLTNGPERRREDLEKLNDSVDESEDSDMDETVWHSKQLDPEEADVYLDALWGPLFFRYERIRKDKDSAARFSDYRMVSLFLLLNLVLQLAIAWKINEVSSSTYGSIGEALFNGACWRLSSNNKFFDVLYPSELRDSNDFDCLQPILTLSMLPKKLDLDGNGFWSTDEANAIRDQLEKHGSKMAKPIPEILERMAKYDFENRIGSKSRSQDQDDVSLDMKFFEHFRGKIEMCLPIDPNLCGNLEVRGKLKTMLPEDLKHAQDRVAACRENFEKFCMKMFGENYQWIHYVTSEVCGDSTFSREKGANKVTYSAVTTYKGESDSILGTTFVSFLVLLLFIWGMLMIVELRSTFNFLYVVWYTPSTQNSDPTFASFDQKMEVNSFPISHKIFAVLCIGIPRGVIAVVVLVVGARFLSATNNLQDLVLNTTALCFLIEVDNIIHASFLGESFEKRVTHRCEVITVSASAQGTWQPYVFFAVVLLTTAAWTGWVYFNEMGLQSIGDGLECLCQFDGQYCFGKKLVN